ncbi:glycosyltransferase family 4 protein [Pantoea sp. LS15]|uniref:glycosyltransferase family 4 protein n=1 Tax=Enterobacterales TaxID=91347 RepID=UPI000E0E8CB8|nr:MULTISPECIES: glycosyltransferase family 4 protein [Enterobacterales]NJQ19138.1 glycosyltransferase family 4 protein [Pantoea sp. LS15]NKF45734.1 glycosyltransferase family 4 protein [Pantoea sp. LS15]RDK16035.1 glycosyltransferase family 1 protein [Enterobacter sp. 9-2]
MKDKIIAITANTCWYIYNFRKNTIISLIEHGYHVIACAPRDDYTSLLEELGCAYEEVKIDKSGINPLNDIYTVINFYKIFKRNNVVIVLNFTPKNNIYSTIAAKICKVKVINNIAGLGAAFGHSGWLNLIVKTLYKFSQSNADFIFFQNEDDSNIFRRLGISGVNTDILPGSGVDLKRFTVTRPRMDGVTRFALIARMLTDKGILQYVGAAKNLKSKYNNVEFLLVGFIDDKNPRSITTTQMNGWVSEGHVKYLGVSDSIEKILGDVDCVVLPSFYREGVPKSLLEAAAMGKPLITTDNVGCKETLEDGVTGFLCEPRSVESLSDKMELIINMPEHERIAMGTAGRNFIETRFDEQIVINKYLNAIETIMWK